MADFVATFHAVFGRLVSAVDPNDTVAVFSPDLRDGNPPTVAVVSPALGQVIPRNVPWVVDVTDDRSVPGAALYAEFRTSRLSELIWKGDRFTFRYGGSTRTAIAGGYRYSLIRDGGWPSAPTFGVLAWDGNNAP